MEKIINDLYKIILERKYYGEKGSYTKYLLDSGTDKILKKFGEEAVEVIIASKGEDKSEQVNEICDLVYHLVVLMVNNEIILEEIEEELSKRKKVLNNFKGERNNIDNY